MGNIQEFLSSPAFGVVGASKNREKFGNKVLRCYLQRQLTVYPVHPLELQIEGVGCLLNVTDLPPDVKSLSLITPPAFTEKIVEMAHEHGIENIWMQPGAASDLAVSRCLEYGINVIANGPCILVELGCH